MANDTVITLQCSQGSSKKKKKKGFPATGNPLTINSFISALSFIFLFLLFLSESQWKILSIKDLLQIHLNFCSQYLQYIIGNSGMQYIRFSHHKYIFLYHTCKKHDSWPNLVLKSTSTRALQQLSLKKMIYNHLFF